MTDAEIKNLRDLLREATPGPWKNHTHEEDEGSDWATISAPPVVARSGYEWTPTVGVCDGGDSVENAKNAALIVAAVNALPSLLDEVERLRADAARYRWLRERAPFWAWQPDSNCYPGITVGFSHSETKYCDYTLDEAIDAAMGEEKRE